jgi:hypothetical protein
MPAKRARGLVALVGVVVVAGLGVLAGCGGSGGADDTPGRSVTSAPPTTVPGTTPTVATTTPPVGTVAPTFAASASAVTVADLGASWREGCPVGPEQLRRVTLSYWDFDGRPQTGVLVVHANVAEAVTGVFRSLFEQRFPIRRMEPVDRFGASDDASMAADNTSGFNCRLAVGAGPQQWSVHAFGRAIDVNPVENPYVLGNEALPPAGAAFVDRRDVRPGMAVAGGPLVEAFAAAGWQWGGRWTGSPDYQHFSSTGG